MPALGREAARTSRLMPLVTRHVPRCHQDNAQTKSMGLYDSSLKDSSLKGIGKI